MTFHFHQLTLFLLLATVQGMWTMAVGSELNGDARVESFVCPEDDGFFTIPDTCSSDYYACIGGVAFPVSCPSGTVFDPAISTCNTPDLVDSCKSPFTCPESDGFFPVAPGVCSNEFYTCVDFVPYLTNCPGISVYDPEVLKCTSSCAVASSTSSSATADSTIGTETSTETTTLTDSTTTTFVAESTTDDMTTVTESTTGTAGSTSPSTTTQSTSTTSRTTCSTGPGDFTCPSPNGLFPNPCNCSSFYSCSNGTPYLETCPNGLVFNPIKGQCDYPANVPGC